MTIAAVLQIISIAGTALRTARELVIIARQNGELTEQQEQQLTQAIEALQADATKPAHWRIE
jgi:hypothetical protein